MNKTWVFFLNLFFCKKKKKDQRSLHYNPPPQNNCMTLLVPQHTIFE